MQNPGVATYKDFVIWAGLDFPKELDRVDLAEYLSEDQDFVEFGAIPLKLLFSDIYAKESK